MTTTTHEKEYLSCAETAKLLRGQLKRAFPGVTFSVRSKTYAGGASIAVSWTDGPTTAAVDKIAGAFAGADFDGMIDLKCYADHWLERNGTVRIAHSRGTESSRGYLPEVITDPPSPNARLVSLGADYVFCQRDISTARGDEIKAEILNAAKSGDEFDHNALYDVAVIDGEAVACTGQHDSERYGSSIFNRLASAKDYRVA